MVIDRKEKASGDRYCYKLENQKREGDKMGASRGKDIRMGVPPKEVP